LIQPAYFPGDIKRKARHGTGQLFVRMLRTQCVNTDDERATCFGFSYARVQCITSQEFIIYIPTQLMRREAQMP
jgi:hypothetical protein